MPRKPPGPPRQTTLDASAARPTRLRRWWSRANRRAAPVRAVLDRAAQICFDLGGHDATSLLESDLVKRLAFIGAKLESMEEGAMRGGDVDRELYLTLIEVELRLSTTLGLRRRPRELPSAGEVLRDGNVLEHEEPTS
jgi:hypothetical protein